MMKSNFSFLVARNLFADTVEMNCYKFRAKSENFVVIDCGLEFLF